MKFLFGQETFTLEDLQGIWIDSRDSNSFRIIKKDSTLDYYFKYGYVSIDKVGFISKDHAELASDEYNIDSVKDIAVNNNYLVMSGLTFDYETNLGDDVIELFYNNFFYLYRLKKLPYKAFFDLYQLGKKDKRDYLEQFLDIDAREARRDRAYIYSAPDTITKMYLIKGDIFKVLSEQDDWIEMEYETAKGRIIRGWLRREDVEG